MYYSAHAQCHLGNEDHVASGTCGALFVDGLLGGAGVWAPHARAAWVLAQQLTTTYKYSIFSYANLYIQLKPANRGTFIFIIINKE